GSGPALFDIGSGRLTATAPTSSTPYDQLFALPDGSFLCACVASVGTLDPATQHALTTVTVTLRWLGADGTPGRSVTLPTYVGRADPGVMNEPEHAGVTASLS